MKAGHIVLIILAVCAIIGTTIYFVFYHSNSDSESHSVPNLDKKETFRQYRRREKYNPDTQSLYIYKTIEDVPLYTKFINTYNDTNLQIGNLKKSEIVDVLKTIFDYTRKQEQYKKNNPNLKDSEGQEQLENMKNKIYLLITKIINYNSVASAVLLKDILNIQYQIISIFKINYPNVKFNNDDEKKDMEFDAWGGIMKLETICKNSDGSISDACNDDIFKHMIIYTNYTLDKEIVDGNFVSNTFSTSGWTLLKPNKMPSVWTHNYYENNVQLTETLYKTVISKDNFIQTIKNILDGMGYSKT